MEGIQNIEGKEYIQEDICNPECIDFSPSPFDPEFTAQESIIPTKKISESVQAATDAILEKDLYESIDAFKSAINEKISTIASLENSPEYLSDIIEKYLSDVKSFRFENLENSSEKVSLVIDFCKNSNLPQQILDRLDENGSMIIQLDISKGIEEIAKNPMTMKQIVSSIKESLKLNINDILPNLPNINDIGSLNGPNIA